MRKFIVAITLVFVLSMGYAATLTGAQDGKLKNGESPEAGRVVGKTVKTSQGENLGVIMDVVAGPQGRSVFAVLNYWISDDTQKRVAVPLGALSCDEQSCVLHANKNALNAAPPFVLEDDLAEPKLAEHLYRYFGVQPYWTEQDVGR